MTQDLANLANSIHVGMIDTFLYLHCYAQSNKFSCHCFGNSLTGNMLPREPIHLAIAHNLDRYVTERLHQLESQELRNACWVPHRDFFTPIPTPLLQPHSNLIQKKSH